MKKMIKETITVAIQQGLEDARIHCVDLNDEYSNHFGFVKIDMIFNSISHAMENNPNFSVFPFKRGWYKMPLIFEHSTNTLYSFFSKNRFEELQRCDNRNVHYLDALAKCNDSIDSPVIQLSFDDSTISKEEAATSEKILSEIKMLMKGELPTKYFAIAYDKIGFDLIEVKAIMISANMETIEEHDWSPYITTSYDSEALDYSNEVNYDVPLKMSMKPSVSSEPKLELLSDKKMSKDI